MRERSFISRSFEVRGSTRTTTLVLRVYKPTRASTGEYKCLYEIHTGRRLLRRFGMNGEDSVQALLLALGAIVTEIEVLQSELGGRISPGDLEDLDRLRPRPARR